MAKNRLDHYCRHCYDLNGAFYNPAGVCIEADTRRYQR